MKRLKTILLSALVVMATACGRAGDDEFAEATPDLEGLSLEISGDGSEGAALVSEDGLGQSAQGLGENAPELLKNARQGVAYLNANVKRIVEPIAELVAAGASKTSTGDTKVYGPKDKGNVTYRFTIKRTAPKRFGWRLEAKPLGSDDSAYQVVMGGFITKEGQPRPHRGRGAIGIDLDALKSIDGTLTGQGKLLCGFAHVGDAKVLAYSLKGFTSDPAVHAPVTAAFVGHRLMPSRATRIRLATLHDLADSPTDLKELVRARVRYLPGVGGRADALATGGDVPEGKVYVASACWDAQEQEGFAVLRLCVKGQPASCEIVAKRGEISNCKPGLEAEALPPENPEDATLEDESPAEDVSAPASMPSGAE